jgi:hypothetical protein
LITDVFAIDAITEMLNTPLHLLNYLALRARFGGKIFATNELAILGLHLSQNLWLDPRLDGLVVEESLASNLDIAMLARRDGLPGEKTPKGILTRFDGLTIGRFLSEIERIASPQLTGLGLALLQLSSQTAKFLSAAIDRIVGEGRFDGTTRDVPVGVDAGGSGITVHCNSLPEGDAPELLSVHCNVRKYDTKANSWYGLLLAPGTGRIRGALALEHNWKSDSNMEGTMKSWPRRRPIEIGQLASGSGKIGRNTLCSCGSGKKFKKCCLNA